MTANTGQGPQGPAGAPWPQQPPAVPPQGYGYPQGQPGYGYPQQQPGYGYPQQPEQAYPQQPSYGYHPPHQAGPPAKKKKTGLIVLLAVALFVLGGAGTGAWFLLYGGSSGNVLWSVPATAKDSIDLKHEIPGTWFTDKSVVQTLSGGVKAYDINTGAQLWGHSLPGSANTACRANTDSTGDIGVVAFGTAEACDHLVAYDLDSGKQLWTKAYKPDPDSGNASLARSGNTVIYSASDVTVALNVKDGSETWKPSSFKTESCNGPGSFTGGKSLIRTRVCREPYPGTKLWEEISLIDPATGKPEWTYHHDASGVLNDDIEAVLSTSPVVVQLNTDDDGESLITLDNATGKLRSTLTPYPAKYVQTDSDDGNPWTEAGAYGNTFVVVADDGNNGHVVVAYDLDSGKQLWKTDPVKITEFLPLHSSDADRILAYATSDSSEKGPELVEFGAKDGKKTTVVSYPVDAGKGMSIFARPYWHNDRLYVSSLDTESLYSNGKAYSLVALPTTE